MVSLLNSQGMKSCKSRESFCLSILTIYTNDWSNFWHVYWCYVYFFFCEIPKNVQTKNTRLRFYGSGLASLPSWLGIVNVGWLGSIRSEMFLIMKFIIFQGCLIKQAVLLPGQPVPYNQLLIQPLLLVPECYFAENVEAWVLKFKPIFLRMQFLLVATFFSLVLVNSLSWYLYLTISYLTLVTWHFGSQMVFPNI